MNRTLAVLGCLTMGFGLWSAAAALHEPTGRALAATAYWGWPATPLTEAGRWGYAIGGAGLAGWGLMMALLALGRPLSLAVRASAVLWFVLDSGGSVLVGAAPNLLPNVAFLGLAWLASRPQAVGSPRGQGL